MSTALLDLNVFIALVWPAHEHHRPAHAWLAAQGRSNLAGLPDGRTVAAGAGAARGGT